MAKRTDTMTAAAGCIIIGSMAGPIFGYPLIGLGMNILGAGVFTMEYMSKRGGGKYNKLWNPLKLYVETEQTKLYPVVVDEEEHNEGKTLRVKLPIGLSSDDFAKKTTNIKEHFNAKDVGFTYDNGFLFINLKYNKLEKTYEYEPIPTKSPLAIPIGKGLNGTFIIDILKAPHLLIAGQTGSGKSTVLRVIITYLIHMKNIQIHLVDLKEGIEFSLFMKSNRVKTFSKSVKEAEKVISRMVEETKRRYNLFYENDCINIEEYNSKFKNKKLDYEVIIIDEFADLSNTNCIDLLNEFFQKARAAGLHGIVATQRPCSKTLDTRLKANIPYCIGLRTMNRINSNIIIDETGLETLRGFGHSLVRTTELTEIQCFNLSTERAKELIKHTYRKDCSSNFATKTESELNNFDFLKDM